MVVYAREDYHCRYAENYLCTVIEQVGVKFACFYEGSLGAGTEYEYHAKEDKSKYRDENNPIDFSCWFLKYFQVNTRICKECK